MLRRVRRGAAWGSSTESHGPARSSYHESHGPESETSGGETGSAGTAGDVDVYAVHKRDGRRVVDVRGVRDAEGALVRVAGGVELRGCVLGIAWSGAANWGLESSVGESF